MISKSLIRLTIKDFSLSVNLLIFLGNLLETMLLIPKVTIALATLEEEQIIPLEFSTAVILGEP